MKTLSQWEKGHEATSVVLRKCKRAVESVAPGSQVILYGSRARDEAYPESDYDIMVILPDRYDRLIADQVRNNLYDIEIEELIVVSVITNKKSEWESKLYDILPIKKTLKKKGFWCESRIKCFNCIQN